MTCSDRQCTGLKEGEKRKKPDKNEADMPCRRHLSPLGILNVQVGLDAAAAEAFLASGVGHASVQAVYLRVTAMGVHSIPTFLVDGGRFVVNGAANASELEACLRAIEAEVPAGLVQGERRGERQRGKNVTKKGKKKYINIEGKTTKERYRKEKKNERMKE
jgi:peptidyl-tRNA hydrolase